MSRRVALVVEAVGSRGVVGRGFLDVLIGRGIPTVVITSLPPKRLERDTVYVVLGAPVWLAYLSDEDVAAINSGELEVWAMIAPNSDKLPDDLLAMLHRMPGLRIMTPSGWARDVLAELGLTARVVAHGCNVVGPPARPPEPNNSPFVLHFSSSSRERKGTAELARAWVAAKEAKSIPSDAELRLVLGPAAMRTVRLDRTTLDAGVFALPHIVAAPPQLFAGASFVCQPSRGEAFGLVPLEALASGVPAIATTCTGHSEYLSGSPDGLVEVPTEGLEPIDDWPGAVAPGLRVEAVADALARAFAAPPKPPDWTRWRAAWAWQKVLDSWVADVMA